MRFCVTTVSKFKYLSGYKKRVKHFNRTISPEISGNNLNVVISDQPILSLLPLTFSFTSLIPRLLLHSVPKIRMNSGGIPENVYIIFAMYNGTIEGDTKPITFVSRESFVKTF